MTADAKGRRERFNSLVVVASQREARNLVVDASTIAVVDRSGFRSVVFRCPCNCGDTLAISVDSALDNAWRCRIAGGRLTLMPSVWRTSGCESHFILWRNDVWWCGWRPEDDPEQVADESWPREMTDELRAEWKRLRRPSSRTRK